MDNLHFAYNNLGANYWGIDVHQDVTFGVTIPLATGTAIIPEKEVRRQNLEILALSIYMQISEMFEQSQLEVPIGKSGYSEEDLPSNLIGFYAAKEIFKSLNNSDHSSRRNHMISIVQPQIRQMCGAFGKANSLGVYRNTYGRGANLQTGWKNWYPRILTLLDCTGDNPDWSRNVAGACNRQQRAWPAPFAQLSDQSKRIRPMQRGVWWWFSPNPRLTFEDGRPGRADFVGQVRPNNEQRLYKIVISNYPIPVTTTPTPHR